MKLPSLYRLSRKNENLKWRKISINEELGSGMFASEYLVNYEMEKQNVIVKKMKGESAEAKH